MYSEKSPLIILLLIMQVAITGCASGFQTFTPAMKPAGFVSHSNALMYSDDCEILISGKIDSVLFSSFQAVAQKSVIARCSSVNVLLASPGGAVYPAMAMGSFIREKGYNTNIIANNQCSSACGLVFVSGVRRIIGANSNSKLGLHQAVEIKQDSMKCKSIESIPDLFDQYKKYLVKMIGESGAMNYLKLSNDAECTSIKYYRREDLLKTNILKE